MPKQPSNPGSKRTLKFWSSYLPTMPLRTRLFLESSGTLTREATSDLAGGIWTLACLAYGTSSFRSLRDRRASTSHTAYDPATKLATHDRATPDPLRATRGTPEHRRGGGDLAVDAGYEDEVGPDGTERWYLLSEERFREALEAATCAETMDSRAVDEILMRTWMESVQMHENPGEDEVEDADQMVWSLTPDDDEED